MEVRSERIPAEQYAGFVAKMPEACVDLVVEHEGAVLLGRRENEPAKGEWFWPGSRLYKGERLADAARRVATDELGIDVDLGEQLGTNAHFWETSEQGVPRHTVVVVFHATPVAADPDVRTDDQHEGFRWVTDPDPSLHEYVNRYFERFDLPRSDTA